MRQLVLTVGDGSTWASIGLALLLGSVCLAIGVGTARFVGLLPRDAPAGETLGVGLAAGLMIVAAGWAAVRSEGRSSFTPVAIGFGLALVMGQLLADIDGRRFPAAPWR